MTSLPQLQPPGDDCIVTGQAIPMKIVSYSWHTSQHIHPPSQTCTSPPSYPPPLDHHKHLSTPVSSLLVRPSPWYDWHYLLLEWDLGGGRERIVWFDIQRCSGGSRISWSGVRVWNFWSHVHIENHAHFDHFWEKLPALPVQSICFWMTFLMRQAIAVGFLVL